MHPSTTNTFIWAAVIVIVVALYLAFLEGHDARVMKAGEAYTACVKAQYGMTPQAYLVANGSYPVCY